MNRKRLPKMVQDSQEAAMLNDQLAISAKTDCSGLANSIHEFIDNRDKSKPGVRPIELTSPRKALAILKRVAEGVPQADIIRHYGVSQDCIRGLTKRHQMSLEDHKQLMRIGAAQAVDASQAVLMQKLKAISEDPDKLDKTPLKEIGMVYGISFDKSQLTQEQPTSISGSSGGLTIEDFKAMHEKLLSEIPEAEVVKEDEA